MAKLDIPCTYAQAMDHPDANSWLEACQDELLSLTETKTYTPVDVEELG